MMGHQGLQTGATEPMISRVILSVFLLRKNQIVFLTDELVLPQYPEVVFLLLDKYHIENRPVNHLKKRTPRKVNFFNSHLTTSVINLDIHLIKFSY